MQNFGIVLIILLALSAVILLVYVLSKLSELEAIAGNIISSRNQTEGSISDSKRAVNLLWNARPSTLAGHDRRLQRYCSQ